MVSRFTWTNWAKGKVLQHGEKIWQGEHDGYRRLADPVAHRRIILSPGGDRWLVLDHLQGKEPHHYSLHWLLNDFPWEQRENAILLMIDSIKYKMQVGLVEGKSTFSVVRAEENSTRGWRSRYYGDKEPAISVLLETDQPQTTFWSFFGFAADSVESRGNTLIINSGDKKEQFDLGTLNK